jgi:hypothetical protein
MNDGENMIPLSKSYFLGFDLKCITSMYRCLTFLIENILVYVQISNFIHKYIISDFLSYL